MAARTAGRGQILGRGARVATLVEQAGAGEAGRRAADRRHRDAGLQEALGRNGERLAAALVPNLGSGDEQVAVLGVLGPASGRRASGRAA